MTTIPQAAIEAAARALCKADGEDPDEVCVDGSGGKTPLWQMGYDTDVREAILAALPHLAAPALIDDIRRILDEHSAWIARPDADIERAIAIASVCAALRIMGAWKSAEYRELAHDLYEVAIQAGLDPILLEARLKELDKLCGYEVED